MKKSGAFGLPYYKRFPGNFLNGISGMTVEQIAVYSVLIELMYDAWEPVWAKTPKQRRDLARRCGLSVRKFGTTLDELIAADKIQVTLSGRLSNRKFERLAHERGLDTAPTFEKIAKNSPDNRGDNDALFPENPAIEPKTGPTHARDEVRGQSIEDRGSSTPTPPPEKPDDKTGFEELHDVITSDLRKICRALGVHLESSTHRHNWPHQWLRLQDEKKITLEDMLAAIESYEGQPALRNMTSLFWLKDRAIEKRVARMLGAAIVANSRRSEEVDAAAMSRPQWIDAMRTFLRVGVWDPVHGPSPLFAGCLVPSDILDEAELRWTEQGNHPAIMQYGSSRTAWRELTADPIRVATAFAPRSKA